MTGPEVTAAMEAEDAWVEKGARAMWNAQTRQPWQQIEDGDEWPSWVGLATRDRLREKFRHALAAVLPEIQAQALRDEADRTHTYHFSTGDRVEPVHGDRARHLLHERATRLTTAAEEPTT